MNNRKSDVDPSVSGFAPTSFSAEAHSLPLATFAGYLAAELGCEVILIGVQPGRNALDAPLTPQVQAAVEDLVCKFADLMVKE